MTVAATHSVACAFPGALSVTMSFAVAFSVARSEPQAFRMPMANAVLDG